MKDLPKIKGISVDIDALRSIKYKCDPSLCAGQKSCCASYQICMSEKEMNRMIPHLSDASKYAKHIKDGDEYVSLFDEDEDDILLETDDNWQCLLGWKDKDCRLLCSLHTHAIDNNLNYYDIKPKSCCLWPLAANDENTVLTIQEDAIDFPCIEKKDDKTIDPEVASIIENIYGKDFLEELENIIN